MSFPTPVTTREVTGTIRARDVGDSRVTSYFYTFLGNQGDIFINVVTKNFTGDVDVFLADGLKPLTKVVAYADAAENETGRVIYLRKPEKLILRVEGRTPNDDPATFRIKFAGSFEASRDPQPQELELPEVRTSTESGIRVNSVGTIIEAIPKPSAKPIADAVAAGDETNTRTVESETTPPAGSAQTVAVDRTPPATAPRHEVVVTDNILAASKSTRRPARATAATRARARRSAAAKKEGPPADASESEPAPVSTTPARRSARSRAATKTPPEASKPDPLASINLVIEFKDGSRIERPMNEVLRMTVNRGVLTVVAKDGTTGRYSIRDVARTTIQ